MPNTYSQIYLQFVFAVKGRENLIKEDFREELQKYISGIIGNKKHQLIVSGRPSTSCLSLIEFLALSQRKEYDKARRGTAFG